MASALGTGEQGGAAQYLEQLMDKEWKVFHKALASFPHSFQLEHLRKTTCLQKLKILTVELDSGLPTPLEIARTLNLMSYFHFLLGLPRDALKEIEEALVQPGEERNLVSLGNKAAILWLTGDHDKARDQVRALEEVKKGNDFVYLAVKARAELAFSYSVIGGNMFCPKAIQLYREVIAEAKAPEIWMWKFGLALAQRRFDHMSNVAVLADSAEEQTIMSVLDLLKDIINGCESKNLKAKCYSEIAWLLHGRRSKSWELFERKAGLTAIEACEKALEMDPTDSSVLWKCGKFFRYANRLHESLEYLQKSVDLRPTTSAYHHLGLSFKQLAKQAKTSMRGELNVRGRRGSTYGRGRFNAGRYSRQGSHRRTDFEEDWGEGEGKSEIRTGRQHIEPSNYDNVPGHNSRGWSPNRRKHHQANFQGSQRGLDARPWQGNVAAVGSRMYSAGYSEVCSGGQRRSWTNPNITEHALRQEAVTERAGEGKTSTHSVCTLSETVPKGSEGFQASSQRQEIQEPDRLPSDFSRLSLNEVSQYPHSPPNRHESQHASPVCSTPHASGGAEPASDYEIRSLRHVVKSPPRNGEQFSRTDEFVQDALDAFQKAVELSERGNIPAVYDLALMHKTLGEFDEALKWLNTIKSARPGTLGSFHMINAYEQAGLILKHMSSMESDLQERKRLEEDGQSNLNTALRLCSRLCNKLPRLQHCIQHVWHSFPTLIQAVEESDRQITDKLFEKAKLFNLIKDNRQSMILLQEISDIDPEKKGSPDHLKIRIDNYVELGQYDNALTAIEMFRGRKQRSTMDDFDDSQYVQKVYIKAGKAALLNTTYPDALNDAKSYFGTAFADACEDSDVTSSSDDTESMEEAHGNDSWDIMLLHDRSADSKSEILANVFDKVFGLRVTDMMEDCLPGTFSQDSLSWIMKKSKVVVVLVENRRASSKLRLTIQKAAQRQTTAALLMDGSHVPKDIKHKRHMIYPDELLSEVNKVLVEGGQLPPSLAQKLCDLFIFLVNVPFP